MREEDDSLFTRIRRFYFCLLRYVQDYMMKATSYYLPRAYCMLPLLSQDGTCFKDEYLESDFDLGSFGMVGRRRLFWAFLRYELMSRIRLYKATVDSSYTPPSRLNQREGRPFLQWEDEALRCVQQYVSSLYAANYAQWDGIRLPNDRTAADPSHLSCPPGLRPDHHSSQRVDWMAFQTRTWSVSEWFMERLEEYGFGILTDLTYDAKKAEKDRQGPELLCRYGSVAVPPPKPGIFTGNAFVFFSMTQECIPSTVLWSASPRYP
ncbi:hyp1 protein [Fusarium sporotrichioides]|uniref:Hyp1 protein n=1 Tax=Fusarium sporotrichioides TaxID=5514 RepID=A0A395SBY9_FUSSP|nr:hyp1 protein [Fusarium sporotrichioides]